MEDKPFRAAVHFGMRAIGVGKIGPDQAEITVMKGLDRISHVPDAVTVKDISQFDLRMMMPDEIKLGFGEPLEIKGAIFSGGNSF